MGYAKEVTFGTPVAATAFVPADNMTVNADPGLFFPDVMIGQREKQVYPLYGQQKFVGGIEFPLFPLAGIDLFSWGIGADVISGTADPWTHTISPANTLPSFTLEKNLGGLQSEQFAGCRVNKLDLDCQASDQEVKATIDVIAQSVAILGTPTAVSIAANDVPFVFTQASLTTFGSQKFDVTSVKLSFENALKATYTVATTGTATYITPLQRKLSGQVGVVWSSLNDATYGYFAKMPVGAGSAATGTLVLNLTQSASRSFVFTANQIQLSKMQDDIKLGDVVMATLDFEASYVIGSSLCGLVVKNSKGTAY